jgi:hypothetical protein
MRQCNARTVLGQGKSPMINKAIACFGPRFNPIAATIHRLVSLQVIP